MNENFLSVSGLNHFIKDVINAGFPQSLWVCGEIQQYDRNKSKKHVFFELVEKNKDSDEILARIGLVIFANRRSAIDQTLDLNAFELKDDIEVKFLCTIDFYPPHGALRLIVEDIDPAYTLGKIAQEKQRLIASLKAKGTLDKNKHLSMPTVPLHIGLITADDSAAYNDFVSELNKSGYGFKIYLRNTLMQGKNAASDVCRALNDLTKIEHLETVVITRGGGSLAELSCFDSALIAEKIAAYPLPVLSGIGHEINTTITDLAAHTYAKTPTAIAQHLVSLIKIFLTDIDNKMNYIITRTQNKIITQKHYLKDMAAALQRLTITFLKDHHTTLLKAEGVLRHKPASFIDNQRVTLITQQTLIKRVTHTLLTQQQLKLIGYKRIIDIVHPMNTIKRGFSITRDKNGRILRSTSQASVGQEILTQMMDGNIRSKVLQ